MATVTGNYRTWTPDSGIPPPPGHETPKPTPQYQTWTPDSGIPPPPGHTVESPAPQEDSPLSRGLQGASFMGNLFSMPTLAPARVASTAAGMVSPGLDMMPRAEQDIGVASIKGLIGVPQALTGLVDLAAPAALPIPVKAAAESAGIPLHGWSGKMQESLGIKYKDWQDALNKQYSPETQKAQENVANAKGLVAKIGAALQNPSVIGTSIVESIPQMVAGGMIGRGLGALGGAESFLAKYGFAMGEGAMSAGQNAEQTRADSPTGLLTEKQAAIHATSGALTGLISALGGKVASQLGVDDVEKLLAGTVSKEVKQTILSKALARALTDKNPMVRGAGKAAQAGLGALQEGAEEAAQSAQEQIANNLAQGKPWYEGWDQATVMGALTGAAMGAGTQFHPEPLSRSEARKAGVPEEIIRQGQEARTGWLQQPPEVQDAIKTEIQNIATAVDSGELTKKEANGRLKDLHKQYVQPTQDASKSTGPRPLPAGLEFRNDGFERILSVKGKDVGSTTTHDMLADDADSAFPGVRGNAPVRQLSGILIPEATPSNRRKGYGRALLLDAFAQDPNGWLYSSQMTPQGVDVLGKLQTDGLVEVVWKKHGAQIEPFTLNRYSGEIRNWMARLTDKGRDYLGIKQEQTNAVTQQGTAQNDAGSSPRVEAEELPRAKPVRSKGVRESGQANAQGEAQGVAQTQTQEVETAPPQQPPPLPPSPPPLQPPDTYSIKNAYTEARRAQEGMPQRDAVDERAWEVSLNFARSLPQSEVDSLVNTLHNTNFKESPISEAHLAVVGRKATEVENRMWAARAAGDTGGVKSAQNELAQLYAISEHAGTESARILGFRRAEWDKNFSLEGIVRKLVKAKKGALSEAEWKQAEDLAARINRDLEAEGNAVREKAAADAIDTVLREARNTKRQESRKEDYHAAVDAQYATANRWGVDPTQLRQVAEERANQERDAATAYNSALSSAAVKAGLTKTKMEELRNQGKDPATQKGVDIAASEIANDPDYAVLGLRGEGDGQQTQDNIQHLIRLLDQGPRKVSPWYDKGRLEGEAQKLSAEKQLRGEYGDAWEPPPPEPEKSKSKGAKKAPRSDKPTRAERFDAWWQNTVDSAKARLKDIKFTSGIDPQILADLSIVGADYLKRGVTASATWAARLLSDFGEGLRPHLAALWKASHERLMGADTEFKKGTPEESIDKHAAAINEKFQETGVIPPGSAKPLARDVVDAGITDRTAVRNAVHTILQQINPDITLQETHDAISGRGAVHLPRDDTTSRIVTDISRQLALIENIQALKRGDAPLGMGFIRQEASEAERALRQQYNEERKAHPELITNKANQLKSRLQTAETAARNRIADLEREIGSRNALADKRAQLDALKKLPPDQQAAGLILELDQQIQDLEGTLRSKPATPVTSTQLQADRAKIQELTAVRDALRDADPTFQADEYQKWLSGRKAQLAKQKAALTAQLAEMERTGQLPTKKSKGKRELDPEGLTARMEVENAKAEVAVLADKIRRKNLNWGEWAWEGLGEVTSLLPRTLMAGLEMSVVLNQGAQYTAAHPIRAFHNVVDSLRAVISERAAFAQHEDLSQRPNARSGDYSNGKLAITEATGPQSKIEELYQSAIVRELAKTTNRALLPLRLLAQGYMATERGFRNFSNGMRADMFDIQKADTVAIRNWFAERNGKEAAPWTTQDSKEVGRTSNILSGRGTGVNTGGLANWLFFAPRWVWSRIQTDFILPLQMATPKFIGQWNADPAMRIALAKFYLRSLAGMAATMALRYLLYSILADDKEHKPTIEWDPRSGDFLKQKTGNTRIDSFGGLQLPVVLAARLVSGTTKTQSGQLRPIHTEEGQKQQFGQGDAADVIFRWVRSKLGPAPAGLLDWFAGKNVVGKPRTGLDIVGERLTPMTYRDMYEAEKELGWKQGTAAALELFFGARVSTQEPKPPQSTGGLKIGGIGKL